VSRPGIFAQFTRGGQIYARKRKKNFYLINDLLNT